MSVKVLGIDPSLCLGWSLNTEGRPVEWGVIDVQRIGSRTDDMWRLGERGEHMNLELLKLIERTAPDVLAIELVPFTRFKTPVAASGYVLGYVHVQEIAAAIRTPLLCLNTSTVKKHATGSGKADKGAMIYNVQTHWGITLTKAQDDIADAMWIADLGEKTWTSQHQPLH